MVPSTLHPPHPYASWATRVRARGCCVCPEKHGQGRPEPLSKLTVASLEDIGYIVDPSMVSTPSTYITLL